MLHLGLKFSSVIEGDAWWELETSDGSSCSDSEGKDVLSFWVNISGRELANIQVNWPPACVILASCLCYSGLLLVLFWLLACVNEASDNF